MGLRRQRRRRVVDQDGGVSVRCLCLLLVVLGMMGITLMLLMSLSWEEEKRDDSTVVVVAADKDHDHSNDVVAGWVDEGQSILQQPDLSPHKVQDAIDRLEQGRALYFSTDKTTQDVGTGLSLLYTLGQAYHILAQYHVDPTQRTCYEKALAVLTEGLGLSGPPYNSQGLFWEYLGKTHVQLHQVCPAADVLAQNLQLTAQGQLRNIPDPQLRLLTVSSISNCYPAQGLALWEEMMREGFLQPQKASECPSCWAYLLIAHARSSSSSSSSRHQPTAASLASMFDRLELRTYTPWRHATQFPARFNAGLATTEPTPFPDPTPLAACQALERHKADIMQEYTAYHAARRAGTGPDWNEPHHVDAALASSAGDWEYLHLRRIIPIEGEPAGWVRGRCAGPFAKTCAALRGNIPEVNGRLLPHQCPRNGGPWCSDDDPGGNSNNNAGNYAGVVAFYSLAPGASVHLHTGNSNERLKCHLVITAPSDGKAWIEAAGERRPADAGQVFALDDSYVHAVANEGDVERVVLDVSFWHPSLLTDQHGGNVEKEL